MISDESSPNSENAGLIDYNFLCFRQAIQRVFDVRLQRSLSDHAGGSSGGPMSAMVDHGAGAVVVNGGSNGLVVNGNVVAKSSAVDLKNVATDQSLHQESVDSNAS
jgi:hypothetical protein